MELTKFLGVLAAILPLAYGAPAATADSLHPKILAAMKRDLGLDADQAHARVARDIAATDVIEQLQATAGDAFAGAWISGETINVAVTDQALTDAITAAGAVPTVVSSSLAKLQKAQADIDAMPTTMSTEQAGIAAYYVDVTTNKLVIEALSGSTANAESMATSVGLVAGEFEVVTVEALPTVLATVRGGDAYYINNAARCSEGFSVTTGFVSAGHCGSVGATAEATLNGATLGTFAGSTFPGNADMSYIRTVSGTTLSGTIDGYGSSNIAVKGSTASAVGSSICRSGSTSGVHCGTVGALNVSVTYQGEGTVTGLTRTSVCAEPGDSGGPYYTGGQAQGVTSGGSGDCTSGGTTYFQPVNEILSTYGLTLVTS